jgi:hypothetical protein
VKKPVSILVAGKAVAILPPRAPAGVAKTITVDDVHKRCHGVAVEPVEGGYRVTTTAGSVCGETLEDALEGAVRKYEEI